MLLPKTFGTSIRINMENRFLGEEIDFWLELKEKAEKLDKVDCVREIAYLRAKVSFYESRLDEINNFKNRLNNSFK